MAKMETPNYDMKIESREREMAHREEAEKKAKHSDDSLGSHSSLCIPALEFHEAVVRPMQ